MAYIKPSVRVFQDFQSVSPAIATPDLDALIIGPCYQYLDPEDSGDVDLANANTAYAGLQITGIEYPNKFLGAVIDTTRVAVHFSNAKLLMHESPDTNALTVTTANPEEVVSTVDNFVTLKGRGVLPGDTIRLKKDSVVGVAASLVNQAVTYTAKAKGTAGNSITVALVDPGANNSALAITVVGTAISVSLATDGAGAITTTATQLVTALGLNSSVTALITATGTGGTALVALAVTNLTGGVNKVDGDVFETTVIKTKTTTLTRDTIVLAENAPVSHQVAGLDFEIIISPTEPVILANTDFVATEDDLTVNAGIVANVDGVEEPVSTAFDMDVLSGDVHVYYYALRQDLSAEITDLYDVNEIRGTLGNIDPRNPLAYAALKALQNTVNRVRVIGIATNDQVGYQGGLDVASTVDTVYALVPLTQNPVVHAAFSTHVQQFSTPEEGKWRICLVNQALATSKVLTDALVPPEATVTDDGSGFFVRVEDTAGTFVTNGVIPTDVFTINSVEYLVEEVINNNVLLLKAGTGPGAAIVVDTPYALRRDMTKTQQAEEVAAKAGSFGSRRTYYIWPDLVGDGGTSVEGFYLSAAIAGMVAGFPAHKGFTNVGIVGFDDVGRSNRYFNETQLNIMAEEGVYIVVQDAPGAIPYSRHQLSTDPDIVEYRELSITKNIDFVSYFFKRRLHTFIGTWNITPNTLLAINQFTQGLIDFLLSQNVEKIGAPILSGSITSLAQHPTLKDHVDLNIDIEIPYPLNNLNVHLLI